MTVSKNGATFPQAGNDFFKTNGSNTVTMFSGPSLTRQEFAEECDINAIMKRYETVGGGINGLPRDPRLEPFYADFTEMPTDLMGYLDMMNRAETAFMMLPAPVRKEFDNSAMDFVAYASDPGNLDQMRAWGLAPPAKPQEGAGAAPGTGSAAPVAQPERPSDGSGPAVKPA